MTAYMCDKVACTMLVDRKTLQTLGNNIAASLLYCCNCCWKGSLPLKLVHLTRLAEHTLTRLLLVWSVIPASMMEEPTQPRAFSRHDPCISVYANTMLAALQGFWTAITWHNLEYQSMCCKQSNSPTSTATTVRIKMGGLCDKFYILFHADGVLVCR